MFSMKRSVLLFVAVLLTAGLVSGSAQAADAPVLERIVQSGELRVGMSGDQAPFNARTATATSWASRSTWPTCWPGP